MKKRPSLLRRFLSGVAAVFSSYQGAYASTDPRRKLMAEWRVPRATANQALAYNIPKLVSQCRHLERSTSSARAVVEGLRADIIGTGIDVEPDTGDDVLNEKLRAEWLAWCEHAGTDGRSLWEIQSQTPGELACGGCILWRWVLLPERADAGLLPLTICPMEPEWFALVPVDKLDDGNTFVAGIEVDKFNRPKHYHFIDPQFAAIGATYGKGERVSRSEIIHGFEARRPFQTHGEPWLAPVVERIKQEEDLVAIELRAAANTAAVAVAVTSEYHPDQVDDPTADTPESVTDLSPGVVARLYPGESIETVVNNRPSQLIDPFRRMLQCDVAAACRTSLKWLRRDYSGATFMNSRMEQNDTTRLHKATQQWVGKYIASEPYRAIFPWLMMRIGQPLPKDPRALNRLMQHKLMPDRPEYVDPMKDGQAAIQNINGGLSTLEDECSARGKDWRKLIDQRVVERAYLEAKGLTLAEISDGKPAEKPAESKAGKDDADSDTTADESADEMADA